MRYFIHFSYDGTDFSGWQIQPNAFTVQEYLEKAFSTIFRKEIPVTAAGRTDAGVHASKMVAHFDFEDNFNPNETVRLLNSFLDYRVAIQKIIPVKEDAHARFDAIYREYKYYIHLEKSPFENRFSYFYHRNLNLDLMNKAAEILLSNTDFEAFSKKGSDNKTTICKIEKAFWEKKGSQLIFTIGADRFLRNMVRAVVGTILEIGTKELNLQRIQEIIDSKNRSEAGASAPAHGLFLHEILYPQNIYE